MKTCACTLGVLLHAVKWSTLTKGPLVKTLPFILVAMQVITAMEVFSWNVVFLQLYGYIYLYRGQGSLQALRVALLNPFDLFLGRITRGEECCVERVSARDTLY